MQGGWGLARWHPDTRVEGHRLRLATLPHLLLDVEWPTHSLKGCILSTCLPSPLTAGFLST